ncbi:MAG TPA: alcohol dehydrogenase catalytic domain-containing protein [Gaiellales bacterium]|jgi:S-(hydroxymethyl)glutathione dehydrogenase/alcohol dehydrogenase|nr:alcohol dehydrogenase catalytic domain-containing protein [Gaiellales bacterium]
MARAAVCHRFGEELRLEQITLDPPGPHEVLVRVTACGVCHSDLAYAGGIWGGSLPAVYGHEIAGTVLEAGGRVDVEAGQTVVVTLIRSCGSCAECSAGRPVLCRADPGAGRESPIRLADGRRAKQAMACGGFADEVLVHASQVVGVPPDIPPTSACLIACAVLTGMGAVERVAGVAAGESVAVIGAGGVGLNILQTAALVGARPIVAVDLGAEKLATARAFGATDCVDAGSADAAEGVRELTGGGARHVFAGVGSAAVIEQALACAGRGGGVVVVGMPPSGTSFAVDAVSLAQDAKRLAGTKMGQADPARDVPRAVERYLRGDLLLDQLVTATYPLDQVNDALAALRGGVAARGVLVP